MDHTGWSGSEVMSHPPAGSPLEAGAFGSFLHKKQIKPGAEDHEHAYLKCLCPSHSKEFLLFTLESPSYPYPGGDLEVQGVWSSRKGDTKCGNARNLHEERSQPRIQSLEGSPANQVSPMGKLGAWDEWKHRTKTGGCARLCT